MRDIEPISSDDGLSFLSKSAEGTRCFAKCLAEQLPLGSIVGLSGVLGAGKTEFVRGFAEGLGVVGEISSPSYVLEAVYERANSRSGFHHWDLYRLGADSPDETLAIEEEGAQQSMVVVEWPEKVPAVDDLLSMKIVIDFPALPDHAAGPEIGEDSEQRVLRITTGATPEILKSLKQ